MKKIFLTFGIALLGFSVALAQDSDVYQPTDEATETEAIESETEAPEAGEIEAVEEETVAPESEADAIKDEEVEVEPETEEVE